MRNLHLSRRRSVEMLKPVEDPCFNTLCRLFPRFYGQNSPRSKIVEMLKGFPATNRRDMASTFQHFTIMTEKPP